ncbi:hypothetical protein NBRC116592_03970 [Colwellia sp. KU-HH00111]|uniref:hypothetical protein n=1 Tax=Colwellia sp. KU-HH00111 TaxID=3127652 RepID=UPI00310667C2
MASAGRAPLSKLEKAKRKASRDYRKIFEKRALTYDDIYEKRSGNKNMGRKPISKTEQIKRAKNDFLKSLSEHRAEARNESISLPGIRTLLREYKSYRANDSAGRKGSDRVITLSKYIDKEQIKLDKAMSEPCPLETYNGRGRKPMSRDEKKVHYEAKIQEAHDEINELLAKAVPSQLIYYKLREARAEVRRLKKLSIAQPLDDMIKDHLRIHEDKVAELQKEYDYQVHMENKGTKRTLASVTKPLSNSVLENEPLDRSDIKAVVPTNLSEHEVIELLKEQQNKLDEEMRILDELEETLRRKAQVLKQKRELQEAIDIKQRQLIN